MSIYQDIKNLEALIDDCFDPETGEIKPEDDKAYQSLKKELIENGLESLAKVRANKIAFINAVSDETKRLALAKKRETKQLEWLEDYMLLIYNESEKDKKGHIKVGTFDISTRKSTQVCIDEANFNDERFLISEMQIKIDKTGIKNALVAGEQITGAFLKENQNLQVK